MPSTPASIETSRGNSRRTSGSPPVRRTSSTPRPAKTRTSRSISSKLRISPRSSQGRPPAGMQYWQRKLQRSVTETRRSEIRLPWPSVSKARSCRGSSKPHREASILVQEGRADPLGIPRRLDLWEAAQRFLDPQFELEARKAGAHAEMPPAATESLVRVGITANVEGLRILEDTRVAVRRHVPERQLVAL